MDCLPDPASATEALADCLTTAGSHRPDVS